MADYLVNFLNIFTGLRKTIVMLALLIVTCVFRVKGYIDPSNFEGVMKATVVAYFGSNACEHYTSMIKERLNSQGKEVATTVIDSSKEES